MQKALLQLLTIVAIFLLLWTGLSKINWRKKLNIDALNKNTEQKIGDLFWQSISSAETVITTKSATQPLDTLLQVICDANEIDFKKLQIHIIEKDEINAFALPNNHLIVYTGLIKNCNNEAALLGVLGHEVAHIEKKHIFKKLVKEIGLAALISMTTNGSNNKAIKKAVELLTSSSYDRTLESEADITSVDYLIKSNINPEPFADFLYQMSTDENDIPKQIYWISTHPESKKRAEAIIDYIKNKTLVKKNILTPDNWTNFKNATKSNEEDILD